MDNSILMSPTGISHANELAKGSADLKEQLRQMWEAQESADDDGGSAHKGVARGLEFDDEVDQHIVPSSDEFGVGIIEGDDLNDDR